MLLELKVSNFAIIDNIHIQFQKGLNILSGETGAGKSILLKSLGLLMGDKALADTIRTGSESAVIEGSFDLSQRPDVKERLQEMGIEQSDDNLDDTLIVRRIVSNQNKSRIYLNGSLSTLNALRDIVAPLVAVAGPSVPLIEMTGQHENRHLLARAYHLDLLDQYTGVWKLRADFGTLYADYLQKREDLERLTKESQTQAQRLDFLVYQRDEIKALNLRPGEEEELESETKRLKYSARLSEFIQQAESMLYIDDDSVTSRLHYVLQRGHELKNLDAGLVAKLEPLSQAKTLISEVSYELRDYAKNLEADPSRLEDLQARLSSLRHLQKKYGSSVTEILAALNEIESEVHFIENADEILEQKNKEVLALQNELQKLAKDMHQRRQAGSQLLSKGVNDELKDLNMKGVSFAVDVQWVDELSATGQSAVEFMTQTSKNDPPRPLAKFASGGELSRILLSIKQVVGASNRPRTYLFDEVDTGVSGPTAEKVGRKLKSIAAAQQVICVTHLPQVAAFGDSHYSIQKATKKNAASMDVHELKKSERVEEIARLISGEKITKTSLAHAAQLLKECAQ